MRISEVMEVTALTKKAINYYEEEGLIKPDINPENNYREYSSEDTDKLLMISVLRQLDVPVKEIRNILNEPQMLREILEYHLLKLDREAEKIDRSRKVIKGCLDNFLDSKNNIFEMTEDLMLLNKSLQMDDKSRAGYIRRQMQRIFPGNFGKMMIANYSPFLNEPIDTKEKEKAWIELVKFLDEAEDINYSEELKKLYDNFSDEDMKSFEKFSYDNISKWINITKEQMNDEKKLVYDFIDKMKSDADMKQGWEKCFSLEKDLKKQMKDISYYEIFNENLKVLSKDYYLYSQNRKKFYDFININVDDCGRVFRNE